MRFARRVVFDTGVLVSAAILPRSVPALALERALLQFEVCASDETRADMHPWRDIPIMPPAAFLVGNR